MQYDNGLFDKRSRSTCVDYAPDVELRVLEINENVPQEVEDRTCGKTAKQLKLLVASHNLSKEDATDKLSEAIDLIEVLMKERDVISVEKLCRQHAFRGLLHVSEKNPTIEVWRLALCLIFRVIDLAQVTGTGEFVRAYLLEEGIIKAVEEAVHTTKDNGNLQAIACKLLCTFLNKNKLKIGEDACLSLSQKLWHALPKYIYDEEFVEWCLRSKTLLLERSQAARTASLEDTDNLLQIIHVVKWHRGNVAITEEACRVVHRLSYEGDRTGALYEAHMHHFVLELTEHFLENVHFQRLAYQALAALSQDDCVSEELVSWDCVKKIRLLLKASMNDPVIQTFGLQILKNFMTFQGLEAKVSGWLKDIFNALVTHQDDVYVQEAACRTLTKVLELRPEVIKAIGEEEDQLPLHNIVLAAMNIHLKDPYVFEAACNTIYMMATRDKVLQNYLVAKGAYVSIIERMRESMLDSDVQEWGCKALQALCWENPYQKELLVVYATLNDLISLLDHHLKNPAVMEEVIGLLACLASDFELVRHQCMVEKVHVKVLKIISEFEDEIALFEMAFELFASFASIEERELLVQGRVLNHVKELMMRHQKVANLQRKGCIVIQLLAEASLTDNMELSIDLTDVLQKTMSNFEEDSSILTEAIVGLHVLAEIGPSMRKLLVEQNVHVTLSTFFEKYATSSISTIASECLQCLCTEQALKNELLRAACRNVQYRVVDFLLKLGADPDSGPLDDTALCIVVKAGDCGLAELLLSAGASSVETALRLCLEQKQDKLSGTLLRQIGLDTQNSILAWSGLQLKDLKLEYFFPGNELMPSGVLVRGPLKNSPMGIKRRSTTLDSPIGTRNSPWGNNSSSSKSLPENTLIEDRILPTSKSCDETGTVMVDQMRNTRPRTRSGAILPFNRRDPRFPSMDPCSNRALPFQVVSPKSDKSYPGFPDSQLSSDPNFGRLTDAEAGKDSRCLEFGMQRSRSQVLPPIPMTPLSPLEGRNTPSPLIYDSSDDNCSSPKLFKRKERLIRFASTGSLLKPKQSDVNNNSNVSSPVIKYVDLSCNSLTNVSILLSTNVHMRHLVTNLEKLDLSRNQLSSIPAKLCVLMEKLRQLYIHDNNLSDFPYDLLTHRKLEVMDLSYNRIRAFYFPKMQPVICLSKLNVSYNSLDELPTWISTFFPGLVYLSFAGNRLQCLPKQSLALRQLRELNLSNNRIKNIPLEFLYDCPLLRKLDLSHNELESLPEATDLSFCFIQNLNLSYNSLKSHEPFFVPPFVLRLACLRVLDLSHNKITQIPPPTAWSSGNLEELKFDHNYIKKLNLSNDVSQWNYLRRLTMSSNKLEEIPPSIGRLTSLRCLDISNNPKIVKVPYELGRLKNLCEFPMTGLKIALDPSVDITKPSEIVSSLRLKLKQAVPYNRFKLMFVGQGGRGKSTLLRQLFSVKHPSYDVATLGVEVRDWIFKQPKSHAARNSSKKCPTFAVSTWDFAGQTEFYSTHQCFLTRRALYLAVFDASRGSKELELLRPWLLNIQAGAPGASVVLVGTHADQVQDDTSKDFLRDLNRRVQVFIQSPGFPDIKGYAIINCLKESKFMEQLRFKIYDVMVNFSYKGQPIVDQMAPKSYLQLEELIKCQRRDMQKNGIPPLLMKKKLFSLATNKGIQLDEDELVHAMKFLTETGVILFFDDSKAGLDKLFFIDPEWLCQFMARVVTVKEVNPYINADAILQTEDMGKLFSGDLFPASFLGCYIYLLRKFDIVLPLDAERNLVPCRLPNISPTDVEIILENPHLHKATVCRRYVFPYIPLGFWSRVIVRLTLFADAVSGAEKSINAQKLEREAYWLGGIYKHWSEESFFLVTTSKARLNAVDVIVPTTQGGYMLLGYIVDHLDTLLAEWYPGISHLAYSDRMDQCVQRLIPCPSCPNDRTRHEFALAECINESYESDYTWCPVEEAAVVLEDIAPDVLMGDLKKGFVIPEDHIEVQENESHLLGGGSFGKVYKARYKNQNVAVKVFSAESNLDQHRQLRQEVNILRRMRHPSLISMVGVCLRPRTLVMELAPMGALSTILKSGKPLSRAMQHRIAYQVTDGLAFLHRNCIVYRDLKPSNILIFSMSAGVHINAKIADYGISQYATPLGLASNEGTAGYRAPEVERGDTGYNTEVDIYSLGVTFHQLVVGGNNSSGYSPINDDNICFGNRMLEPLTTFGCAPWPDMEDLIQHCVHVRPEKRPTAEEIKNRIASADFLCLRLEVGVWKNQSIECMTIRKSSHAFQDKLEAWVGSGDSEGLSQILWFDPTSRSKPKCRGTVIKEGRIFCMTTWRNENILIGTKQGYIIVFDAETHQQTKTFPVLPDSVLCLKVVSTGNGEYLLAGLANGQLAIYTSSELKADNPTPDLRVLSATQAAVTCLAAGRKRIFCGVGSNVVTLRGDGFNLDRQWRVCDDGDSVVSSMTLGKHLWISCKGSCVVNSWDIDQGTKLRTVDCYDILRSKCAGISKRESRAISIFLQGGRTLWIGTGEGHIILIDLLNSCIPVSVFSRHMSGVRCFVSCSASIQEKPVSLVLSGGLGFKERGPSHVNESSRQDGCLLVWESDLARQHTHLENERKAREKLAMTTW